jgi:CheY-like chemotaxis protein
MPDKRNQVAKPHVCFSVADTGIGMSEEYVKYQLFTPFAQENSLSPGTGLGLSIVSQIVKNLNGTLDVKSEIGRGTVIKVHIPLNQDTGGPLSIQLPPITEDSSLDPYRILRGRSLCYISPQVYKVFINPNFEITSDVLDRSIALRKALNQIASKTLGMRLLCAASDDIPNADLYFLDDHIFGNTMNDDCSSPVLKSLRLFTPLIVMCGAKVGSLQLFKSGGLEGSVFATSHPLGPKKLAITLSEAIRLRKQNSQITNEPSADPGSVLESSDRSTNSISTALRAHELDASRAWSRSLNDTTLTLSDEQFPSARTEPAQISQNKTYTTALAPASPPTQPPAATHHFSLSALPEGLSPTDTAPPTSTALTHLHLLLVDDNPINLKILTTIVRKMRCTFTPASNGLEALQIYRSSNQHFDVIFMDISMPVMDGFTATREIRAYEREMKLRPSKIVALTGLGSTASRQEAFASGTNLFLTKPVRLQEIRELLVDTEQASASHKRAEEELSAQEDSSETKEPFDLGTETFDSTMQDATSGKPVPSESSPLNTSLIASLDHESDPGTSLQARHPFKSIEI